MILLGAVGAYEWIGTVVHQTAQKSDILPRIPFEEVLEDQKHGSLLGKTTSFPNAPLLYIDILISQSSIKYSVFDLFPILYLQDTLSVL